ncbi:hypothetical protein SUDANB132_04723 [Streptomyces sp. enrichment culture]
MKIVIPGGTGQVGSVLNRALSGAGHEVVVLTRRPAGPGEVYWDGATAGEWAGEIDGSDVVINLAGRSVSCRYTPANLRAMMDSRVLSTRVVGDAIGAAVRPPRVWLQMSTATVYAHRFDAPHDEATGVIGGTEPDVPDYWSYSVEIARCWEREQEEADTPHTRKVALRSAMVMSPDRVASSTSCRGWRGSVWAGPSRAAGSTCRGSTTTTSSAPSSSWSTARTSPGR